MKKTLRILSYAATALAACAATVGFIVWKFSGSTKLDQIEYLIENRFIEDADMTAVEDAAADAMISSLGDRWSYYLSAEEYSAHKEQTENAYVGIGVTIQQTEDGTGFSIISVQSDSGAQQAGLQAGDVIVSANGENVADMTVSELRSIIRGEEGTQVTLGIVRGEETLSFNVTRAKILTDVVTYQMLDNNIGLVAIHNFDARCAEETISAIEDLQEQGACSIIFDVRNNPGGYVSELVKTLDYLLPEGVLFRSVDYAGNESVEESDSDYLDMPMAVICNEDSYSAAEFFPAAIQEYGAGTIVGMPTCGKGYFQYTYEFSDGSAVGLSAGKYFTPEGKSLIGVGLQPDITVEVSDEVRAAIAAGTLAPEDDPQIQAAVEVLTAGTSK